MTHSDVVIIGGGVVGHTLACGIIERTALSVTLVDAIDANNNQDDTAGPGFDSRVIALSKRTVDALGKLGITVAKAGAMPIKHIQVTDQGHAGYCALDAGDYQLDAFGQVVSLSQLGAQLRATLQDAKQFSYRAPATVTHIEPGDSASTVTFADGQQLTAKLVVMADGGRSPLAASLGYQRDSSCYGQTAIIANIHTSEPHNNRAYERFTKDGPLALLPFDSDIDGHAMPGHGFSVVWTRSAGDAQSVASSAHFARALQEALGYRQGKVLRTTSRVSYPLALSYTTTVAGQRSVIVGNAAHTLHPIAGQGFNLGMRDCLSLIALLQNARDAGCADVTHAYARTRKDDRTTTMGLTHMLVHAFSNRHLPLVVARNLGLMSMSLSTTLKKAFVRQTTGFGRGSYTALKESK